MKESILLSVRAKEGAAAPDDGQAEALRYALALCRELGARLTVLAVTEDDPEGTHWLCVQERRREEAREGLLPTLEAARRLAAGEGVECSVEGRVGDFFAEVETWAKRHRPHLVMVACPPPIPSLRWCQDVASQLRGRLRCPVVSLVPRPFQDRVVQP